LCDSRFTLDGYKNLIGPVIRLRRLSDDELLALIVRITKLYSQYYQWNARITDDEMQQFLKICLSRAGADSMITPREMLRDYMTLLNILLQNEEATFAGIVEKIVTLKTTEEEKQVVSNATLTVNVAETKQERPIFRPEDIDF
jgi:hypothetical protein